MKDPRSLLEVEQLCVQFGSTPVLSNLSFSVREGSMLAIIGPNGAGKTVLLRSLLGSIPSRGAIRWKSGVRIGYVPQKLDLERDIPVTGLDLLRARVALTPRSEVCMPTVLDTVGLPARTAEQLIGTISGGQFQRLLIAFALIGRPNVLLLDEPTAGVDEPGQEQIYTLLDRLQREQQLTVIFISHDLSVVYRFADEVLCISRKRPHLGAPQEVLTPAVLEEVYGVPLSYHVHDS